jgi:hypothetical protein
MEVAANVADLTAGIQNWATQPFTNTMDLRGWIEFTGLIIVVSILWFMALKEVEKFL